MKIIQIYALEETISHGNTATVVYALLDTGAIIFKYDADAKWQLFESGHNIVERIDTK